MAPVPRQQPVALRSTASDSGALVRGRVCRHRERRRRPWPGRRGPSARGWRRRRHGHRSDGGRNRAHEQGSRLADVPWFGCDPHQSPGDGEMGGDDGRDQSHAGRGRHAAAPLVQRQRGCRIRGHGSFPRLNARGRSQLQAARRAVAPLRSRRLQSDRCAATHSRHACTRASGERGSSAPAVGRAAARGDAVIEIPAAPS